MTISWMMLLESLLTLKVIIPAETVASLTEMPIKDIGILPLIIPFIMPN